MQAAFSTFTSHCLPINCHSESAGTHGAPGLLQEACFCVPEQETKSLCAGERQNPSCIAAYGEEMFKMCLAADRGKQRSVARAGFWSWPGLGLMCAPEEGGAF